MESQRRIMSVRSRRYDSFQELHLRGNPGGRYPDTTLGSAIEIARGITRNLRLRAILARARGLDPANVATPHQVHSSNVEIAKAGHVHPETDGLFTNDYDTVLSLQVADCGPVYFNHTKSAWRGLVHAGWRGAADGIMAASLELLQDQTSL